jgi:hypothetical protein
MNDDYTFLTNRRRFVQGTGSLVALGSVPAYLTANEDELQDFLGGIQQGVVLYRKQVSHAVDFAGVLARAGLTAVALSDDPVRQWRDGLGDIAGGQGVPITGLTNWADYLVLSGLAAEQRKHVVLEMQHPVTQPGSENWPTNLATGLLQFPFQANRKFIAQLVAEIMAGQPGVRPGETSLFSWIIV